MDPFTMLAIAFVMLAVSYVIQSIMAKNTKPKPAGLEEWDFPQYEDGTPKAVLFGDAWTSGPMVLWYGNYRTKKIKSGGKK